VSSTASERSLYPNFIHSLLGKAARAALEKLMDLAKLLDPKGPVVKLLIADAKARRRTGVSAGTFGQALSEALAEGRIEGQAELLLRLLRRRRFRVTEAVRARVMECQDADTLARWAERVLTARRMTEVFAEDEAA
jgi:hypothetical protein